MFKPCCMNSRGGEMMEYRVLAETYQKVEATTKRLEMTAILVELFKATPSEVIARVVYLTQGRLYPDFVGVELGLADKLAIKALSFVSGLKEDDITRRWMKEGDLGIVAEAVVEGKKQRALFSEPLTVERVYSNFEAIARASGTGAQDTKMKLMGDILHDASPLEAKFILRTVVGKLRLGIADMTILEALAQAFVPDQAAEAPPAAEPSEEAPPDEKPSPAQDEGPRSKKRKAAKAAKAQEEAKSESRSRNREEVENAYNLCSDLGEIARRLAEEGIEGIRKIGLEIGRPVRPMLAERLPSMGEILEKLGGNASFEYKYDGMRLQAHIRVGKEVRFYSRQLENVTEQFPDVKASVLEAFDSKNYEEAIVDGECVPFNPETGEMLPFQEVSHRRGRKYGVDSAVEEYPVMYIVFDCLQVDGKTQLKKTYSQRRALMKKLFRVTERVQFSIALETSDPKEAERFFEQAIISGCEGIVAKSVKEDSTYRAGARGWQWIKCKRDYKAELEDTVDLVPVGAFAGHGKRKGLFGALLMAAYNPDMDRFETVCKLGSGFSDALLKELTEKLGAGKRAEKHPRVESTMKADFWLVPSSVLEVLGAEITLSPIHTAGFGKVRAGSGLAIRFPRHKQLRTDKAPEDATTVQELVEMYGHQLKKLE